MKHMIKGCIEPGIVLTVTTDDAEGKRAVILYQPGNGILLYKETRSLGDGHNRVVESVTVEDR